MSWYFFGGFSAYWMVPSGRSRNHSGCSVAYGWSGRALVGDVERDLEPVLGGGADEVPEVLDRAELRVDRRVAALGRADRPGAARVVRAGDRAVVGALAEAPADRVDRWQVEDVEAHRRDLGEPGLDVGERAVTPRLRGRGAREQLVPRPEAGPLAVDDDGELRGEARCEAALRVTVHEVGELARRGRRPSPCPATADRRGKGEETRRVGPGRPRGRSLDEAGADEEVRGDILAGGEALRQVARPGGEVVDPGDDGVAVAADLLDRERRPPAVVDERRHRCLGPVLVDLAAMEEDDGDHVVPVGVGDGLDLHRVADDALDRERAAVDAGGDAVDDDAAAPVARAHRCSSEIVQRDCRSARTVSRRRPIGTGPSSPGRWRPS